MKCGGDSCCKFCRIQTPVKKRVNITALVCSCQKIVELPHVKLVPQTAEIIITHVCLGYAVYLCIGKQHPWQCFLIASRQTLVQSHSSYNLAELVFAHARVFKLLHQMKMLGRIVAVEQLQCGTVKLSRVAYTQIILISVCEDAHVTTDLILKTYSQTEQLWNFLGIKIHLVVSSHSYNRKIQFISTYRFVNARHIYAESTSFVINGLVRFKKLVGRLVYRFGDSSLYYVGNSDVCLLHTFAIEERSGSILYGFDK